MDKYVIPQPRRCTMRFWHRLIDDSQLLVMEDLPAQTYLEHRYLRETLQQACTRSLLPPALMCAIPLRPNRRQILPTAWAISEFWHSTTRPCTSLPQSYAEFTAACLALEMLHLTTDYALLLGRSRNTKRRLRLGVSETTSLQDTVPVVTQIPQGWSPDSQFTAHSLPTYISSIHSESFVCDSLPTPCARLRWQEVNHWHHGPLYICIIPRTCLRLQEIKLRRRGPPNSSSTSSAKAAVWAKPMAFGQGVVVTGGYRSSPAMQCGATVTTALTHIQIRQPSANFFWQENKLRQPDPQCLHELFKITANSDWKPASKPMPPPQGHEPTVHPLFCTERRLLWLARPMVHPLVLFTVRCFLQELGFLFPHSHTQPTLALTVALTTTLPLQFDFTSSPRVIS